MNFMAALSRDRRILLHHEIWEYWIEWNDKTNFGRSVSNQLNKISSGTAWKWSFVQDLFSIYSRGKSLSERCKSKEKKMFAHVELVSFTSHLLRHRLPSLAWRHWFEFMLCSLVSNAQWKIVYGKWDNFSHFSLTHKIFYYNRGRGQF